METNKQAPFYFIICYFSLNKKKKNQDNNKTCANHTRVEVVSRPAFSNAAITRVVGYMSKVFQQRRLKTPPPPLGPINRYRNVKYARFPCRQDGTCGYVHPETESSFFSPLLSLFSLVLACMASPLPTLEKTTHTHTFTDGCAPLAPPSSMSPSLVEFGFMPPVACRRLV